LTQPADRTRRILAAGLSPAWQQILVFDKFHTGRVNRASEVHWCGSGKVLNVAIALAQLSRGSDVECRALSVIGKRARDAIEPELMELGVSCRWILTAAETRICTTIVERASGRTTELVENARPLDPMEVEQFHKAFIEEATFADVVVLTGSLPSGAPDSFYRELLRNTSAKVVLDARGPELLKALEYQPLVVKPNREELAATVGRDLANRADLHAAMQELNARGAQWTVVTHGPHAIWASHQGDLYEFEPPKVDRVVNPIGSGDCLAGGIAWATAAGMEMRDAIGIGLAAAAQNAASLLPARVDRTHVDS
jgi:1-phosphofructokinase family hexose kinase